MTRLAATAAAAPASIWGGLATTVRTLGTLLTRPAAGQTGLDALEREHSRIRLSSRHWLMG